MTNKQQMQSVALDLKRTVNYRLNGDSKKADYFFNEAKTGFSNLDINIPEKYAPFIKFEGNLEEVLMTSTILGQI